MPIAMTARTTTSVPRISVGIRIRESGFRAASRIALRLRAQGDGAADKKARQRGNAIPSYLRAPASFKRRLGTRVVLLVTGEIAEVHISLIEDPSLAQLPEVTNEYNLAIRWIVREITELQEAA